MFSFNGNDYANFWEYIIICKFNYINVSNTEWKPNPPVYLLNEANIDEFSYHEYYSERNFNY